MIITYLIVEKMMVCCIVLTLGISCRGIRLTAYGCNHEMRVENYLEDYSQRLINKEQLCQFDRRFCIKHCVSEIAKTM